MMLSYLSEGGKIFILLGEMGGRRPESGRYPERVWYRECGRLYRRRTAMLSGELLLYFPGNHSLRRAGGWIEFRHDIAWKRPWNEPDGNGEGYHQCF